MEKMKTTMKKWFFLLLLGTTIFNSCKSDYERMVEEGLASGERHDSLFLGIYLGMTAKDFFAHCWELNKQHLIKQGNANTSVEYEMNELKSRAMMNFYPTFHQDEIHEMPVMFNYIAWAPWNKSLWADSLILDVQNLMLQWYGGNDFIKMEHPEKGFRYVKVDGNRRIILWKEDDQFVKGLYTDLTKEKEMNAEKEAKKENAEKS